jgi:ankyrin repeat protein
MDSSEFAFSPSPPNSPDLCAEAYNLRKRMRTGAQTERNEHEYVFIKSIGSGKTPLMHAVLNANKVIANMLLKIHPERQLLEVDRNGMTVLMHACVCPIIGDDNVHMADFIMDTCGKDLEEHLLMRDSYGMIPIMYACNSKAIGVCKRMLKSPELAIRQLRVKDGLGKTLLMHACQKARINLIKIIVDSVSSLGGELKEIFAEQDSSGRTPLRYMVMSKCQKGDLIFVLGHFFDAIGVADNTGVTPWMYICQNDYNGYIMMRSIIDVYGDTALSAEVVRNLSMAMDNAGIPAIFHVFMRGTMRTADYLMTVLLESDIVFLATKRDASGRTLLMHAAANGWDKHVITIFRYAGESGLYEVDKWNKTALIYACENDHYLVVKELLNAMNNDTEELSLR